MRESGLSLYFDTTVILDLLRPARRPLARHSVELLERALESEWRCTSSYFALMEALDIEQENMWFRNRIRAGEDVDALLRRRRKRDQLSRQAHGRVSNQLYRRFVEEVQDRISWVALDNEAWEQALTLAMSSSIRAPDCLHVATATADGCHLFVTSDEILRELAEEHIRSANPVQVLAAVRRILT